MLSATEHFCRICGNRITTKNRQRSHHITRSAYWENGDVRVVSENGNIVDAKKQAKEHNLLCWDCDHKIAKWEDERSKVFTAKDGRPIQSEDDQVAIVGHNYNNEHIVLACLADIFRCSISNFPIYSKVNLGEKHERRIADILCSGKIKDFSEYPVTLGRFNNESAILDHIAQVPQRLRLSPGRINYYRAIPLGGWVWMVKIDQRPFELLDKISLSSSQETLVINLGNAINSPLLKPVYETALAITKTQVTKTHD